MKITLSRELAEKVFGLYLFAMKDNEIDLSTFKEDSIFMGEIERNIETLTREEKLAMIESLSSL